MPSVKRVFVVQPYWRAPGGLKPGQASRHASYETARRYADRLLPTFAGAHVLSLETAPGIELPSEPALLASVGDPPDWIG